MAFHSILDITDLRQLYGSRLQVRHAGFVLARGFKFVAFRIG
jgi:hypothetical protein